MKNQKRSKLRDESGMATFEVVPLIIVFLVIGAYTLGSFGITHTAILNSIAARNYAFETFRNRADLGYLRSDRSPTGIVTNAQFFNRIGNRIHAVTTDSNNQGVQFPATERRIAMGLDASPEQGGVNQSRQNKNLHNTSIYSIQFDKQNETFSSNPVWIMTQYGICLNARCGDK